MNEQARYSVFSQRKSLVGYLFSSLSTENSHSIRNLIRKNRVLYMLSEKLCPVFEAAVAEL